MATAIGPSLPPPLLARLAGSRRAAPIDVAVALTTVDDEGFPHPALLTYAEVAAGGPRDLRLAVAATSRTAANLRRDGRAALSFIDTEGAWYVKAVASGGDQVLTVSPGVVVFPMRVVQVLADTVDVTREPEAAILSGIRFRRSGTGTTL
jgi:Pyridoxamine 5'-phosphate oxidase